MIWAEDASTSGLGDVWIPVLILLALLLLAYFAMWRGWKRRSRKHDLPPLVPVPEGGAVPEARLQSDGRYFGTTVSGVWLDRVVAHGLGARGVCRITLSDEGLDVLRSAGAFRIPAEALRGARHDQGLAGKVVPPHGLLVVTWQHGELLLDTGFRLTEFDLRGRPRSTGDEHDDWVSAITTMVEEKA
jgi:hypothetical protein